MTGTGHGALARLVGDTDRFLTERFGRTPVHVPGADAGGFADWLELDTVEQLVAASGLRAPAFRLVRDGATLPRAEVTRSARIGSRPVDDLVDVAAVHRAFAEGASIVLQGLHRSWAPVARACRSLEQALTHPVQANAYLTPPIAQGLDVHADAHDVFAVQTHGVKRWVVHPPDGGEAWDLELRAGDVLYLPAGTRHAAQTLETASLHLTLGVRTVTWRDLARRALDAALTDVARADDALDAPLPAGWAHDPEALTARLRDHLSAVADAIDGDRAEAAVLAAADAHVAARPPELTGGLRDLLELDTLDDDTPLRVRPGAVHRCRVDGEVATLVLGDRRLRLPATVAPALERIAARGALRPRELEDLADEPSRRMLCRRLVREGWLTFDRTPSGTGAPGA